VIGFRGYAQRDPLNEYRTEAFSLFEAMLANLRRAVTTQVMRVELVQEAAPQPQTADLFASTPAPTSVSAADPVAMAEMAMFGATGIGQALPGKSSSAEIDPNDPSTWANVNRNDACPCGSGKKYKHCHGRLA
jgi:preprotein translocase subunit SecA